MQQHLWLWYFNPVVIAGNHISRGNPGKRIKPWGNLAGNGQIEKIILEFEKSKSLTDLPNIKKLTGFKNYYRLRIGEYRLGFEKIDDNTLRFIMIAHRKDIYKLFPWFNTFNNNILWVRWELTHRKYFRSKTKMGRTKGEAPKTFSLRITENALQDVDNRTAYIAFIKQAPMRRRSKDQGAGGSGVRYTEWG